MVGGHGVEYCYLLMYFVEADKNSVRWGVWAVRWHKAGSFARVGFCVSALCALQMCLTWCVGSCRQSHGCLNVCRMSFRVTYNSCIAATLS